MQVPPSRIITDIAETGSHAFKRLFFSSTGRYYVGFILNQLVAGVRDRIGWTYLHEPEPLFAIIIFAMLNQELLVSY